MSEQTHEPAPEYLLQGRGNPQGGANVRALGVQECPNCGAENHASATVCHECGEHLRQRPKIIRCRQCGQRASSNLIICPSCGRELHAAPSRLWTWVVPVVVGLLLLIFLFSRLDGGPMAWVRGPVDRGSAWISSMGEEMAPELASEAAQEMTPIVEGAANLVEAPDEATVEQVETAPDVGGEEGAGIDKQSVEEMSVALQPTDTPLPAPTEIPTEEPTLQPSSTPAHTPTDAPTATATESPTEAPTLTVAPTVTATPAATVAPTGSEPADVSAILQPTAASTAVTAAALALVPTETPQPSPTPQPRTYDVQPGDTLSSIASRFDVTVEALMAANDIAAGDVYSLRVGEALEIPGLSGQGGPSTLTYTVRAGDTFVNIANRFNLSTEALRLANNLTADQVRLLRPGQVLVIPSENETPASQLPTAAATKAEPTPVPTLVPTATQRPTPTKPALRLDAPTLRSPETNTYVSCQGNEQLAWGGVDFITPTDEYVLHLGFVNGMDAQGNETIVWVLHQVRPPNRTAWDMDNGLCGLAPQAYGRQWRWYVDVVDAEAETVSHPSETWGFSWN